MIPWVKALHLFHFAIFTSSTLRHEEGAAVEMFREVSIKKNIYVILAHNGVSAHFPIIYHFAQIFCTISFSYSPSSGGNRAEWTTFWPRSVLPTTTSGSRVWTLSDTPRKGTRVGS